MGSDIRIALAEMNKSFNVGSMYRAIAGQKNDIGHNNWKIIWKIQAPERIRCFT